MNKAELVDAISKKTSQTKADVEKNLDAFIEVVSQNITSKEGVKLVGFGTFTVSDRKERVGRNPQTGEEIKIPARKVPVFRPGKELKCEKGFWNLQNHTRRHAEGTGEL